jgi:hypothetical protein
MTVTLAATAPLRLSLGYNGTGSGTCGYNNQVYDPVANPGGMDGNGVSINWINMCADMVSAGLTAQQQVALCQAYASTTFNQNTSWNPTTPLVATYVDGSDFTVPGNQVANFLPNGVSGRAMLLTINSAPVYAHVLAASYNSGTGMTTVTTIESVVAAGLTGVQYGQDPNSDPYSTSTGSTLFQAQYCNAL